MSKPGFSDLDFAPVAVTLDERADGSLVLRSELELPGYARCIGEWLAHWADAAPQRTYLAERAGDGSWRRISYAETLDAVRAVGQALLDRNLDPARPFMILSGNSIDVAILQLAALHVGMPSACISPAYSLMSADFGKLKFIAGLLEPEFVYAADGEAFAAALACPCFSGAEIVVSAGGGNGSTDFTSLLEAEPGAPVDAAFAALRADDIAKILFTSGSTGFPKGVINTHRMMCSNQAAMGTLWRFLEQRPPVLVDWLPWSHTFGGNFNFNMILRNGGTLYIDAGKPAPGLVERTVANLKEISPTVYFNVPRGFDMLIPYLETDEALRRSFFRELDLIFYAAAALPPNLWGKLEDLAIRERGERVCMLSALGSTETAPAATAVHFIIEEAGVIGVPVPGTEIKLVPNAGKLEMRVRGPNVTPGYWRRDDLTGEAFDEDGFYRIGDAVKFAERGDPERGLVFDGRVAEDFKLTSGTWVHAGAVRLGAIAAAAPVIQDCVVTGHDRAELGLLIFASEPGCRSLVEGGGGEMTLNELIGRDEVRDAVRTSLAAYNAAHPASSTRIAQVLLMADPPSIDRNEITDKGYINQRAVLENRAGLVEALYGGSDPEIIEIP